MENRFQELARSYLEAELANIQAFLSKEISPFLKQLCRNLKEFILSEASIIQDVWDFRVFRINQESIGRFLNIILNASPRKEESWVSPLIQQSYDRCGIPETHNILLIKSLKIGGYGVYANILKYLRGEIPEISISEDHLDIFSIPEEANHDISSIALIGHEVGHVYFRSKDQEFSEQITRMYDEDCKEHNRELDMFLQKETYSRISSYVEELVCDFIGGRLFGPAFHFALIKLLGSNPVDPNKPHLRHPPNVIRMTRSMELLDEYLKHIQESPSDDLSVSLAEMVNTIISLIPDKPANCHEWEIELSIKIANELIEQVRIDYSVNSEVLIAAWKRVKPELDAFRPPFEQVTQGQPEIIEPIEVVIATTLYFYGTQFKRSHDFFLNSSIDDKPLLFSLLRKRMIDHAQYSISNYTFLKQVRSNLSQEDWDPEALNLTVWRFRTRRRLNKNDPLVIVPSVNPVKQYNSNGVDLRLGSVFLVSKLTKHTHVPTVPTEKQIDGVSLEQFYNRIFVPAGEEFMLHPHHFVLASTLEYVNIPADHYALVLGRSTWGRLGLTIATATAVNSGFRGCLTLELRNLGESPLPLKVGVRIAQLCIIKLSMEDSDFGYYSRPSKYIGPVGPEIPKIHLDADWDLF